MEEHPQRLVLSLLNIEIFPLYLLLSFSLPSLHLCLALVELAIYLLHPPFDKSQNLLKLDKDNGEKESCIRELVAQDSIQI